MSMYPKALAPIPPETMGSLRRLSKGIAGDAIVGYAVEHNTNTARLLTGQFERAGAQVYLASPNFAQVKLNQNHLEDWRPIVQHLAAPPAQTEQEIARLLHGFRALLENRKR